MSGAKHVDDWEALRATEHMDEFNAYMKKHRIHALFTDVIEELLVSKPKKPVDHLMAMLQERIASESYVRSQLADLEDKLHRETGQKMLLERRIAALQAQMLDMRVRAARGDVPLDREDERTAQQRGDAGDEGVQRGEGEAGACGARHVQQGRQVTQGDGADDFHGGQCR